MSRHIENLGQKILYETPGTCALLFAGIAAYCSEGDPPVREQLDNTKHQLRHWSKMYAWGAKFMPILVAAGTLASIGCYRQSKEKLWLWGGAAFFSIALYTRLCMMKTNNHLNQILKDSGEAAEL